MKIILFTLLCILLSTFCFSREKEVIVILPFVNTGAEYKDLYDDLFNGYFYVYFNQLKGFKTLYPSEIINYRVEHLFNTKDLYTIEVLNDITKQFKSDFILGGEYKVENEILKVTLDLFGRKKIIIKREYEANIRTDIYDALNHITMQITKALSGYNPATAVIKAHTDYPSSLYINGVFYGRLPGRYVLPAGEYDIEIIYEDNFFNEVVFRKHIVLITGQLYDLGEIQVLVAYEIKATVESGIYCNGKRIGVTDLLLMLPVGNEFEIEIVYTDNHNERRDKKEVISTKDGKDGSREFEFTNRIKAFCSTLPFSCKVGEQTKEMPYTFDNLETGTYNVQIILEDPEWNREWVDYKEKVTLNIAETAIIDKSDFVYRRNWGLCFIPGAAQFHNFEPVKGYLLLALAIGTLAGSAITGYFAYNYYHDVYSPAESNGGEGLSTAKFSQIVSNQYALTIAAFSGLGLFRACPKNCNLKHV